MAQGWSTTAANHLLDTELGLYTWIKLHTGAPGAAGTANAATETTRKQATWRTSSAGASSQSNALTWTSVAGSETYTHWTAWTASTAGTFGFSGTLTAGAIAAGSTFTIAVDDLDVSVALAS